MHALLDLMLPTGCAGCGDPGRPGCPGCLRHLAGPARWTRPVPAPPGLPPVATIAAYDGAVRELLIAYKERDAAALARPLGIALGRALLFVAESLVAGSFVAAQCPAGPVVVVPVPSSARQCRRRGADVVADLAALAVRSLPATGPPVRVVRALRHVRAVADSAGLDARARASNAAGALGLRRGAGSFVAGERVVVVDDLVTTGVSLAEAAQVLRAAGATVVGAATIAATSRHRAPASGIGRPAAQPRGGGLRCW